MGGQRDLELTMRRCALRDDQWDRMIARRWARRGTRPRAPHDQRTSSVYIFGGHRQLDGVWAATMHAMRPGRRRLCRGGHAGDRGPGLKGLGPGGSILAGGAVIAAEVE